MFDKFIELCIRLTGSHPLVWKLAWEVIHRLTFLLPHDRSYFAFRHVLSGEESLFLDVGANDGISALSIRKLNKACNILSLEPNLAHEPALKRLKARDPKFDYLMVGAGVEACTMSFFVPVYFGIALHTFTSSSRDQVITGLENTFGKSVRAKTKIIETMGEVVRIDDLDIEPSIIKIDAEGFDFQVLQGARQTILTSKPFIAVEVAWSNIENIKKFMDEIQYTILAYDLKNDCFSHTLEGLNFHDSLHHNLFAVSQDRMATVPIC